MISVIMAVMDVEKAVGRALESVLAQTYSNLEIIIIDDGSTDRTAAICECIAEIDNRVRVIRKSHGGTAKARNSGLSYAKGDFVGFVDGDDYVEPDFYACLIKGIEMFGVDISTCGFIKVREQNAIFSSPTCVKYESLGREEAMSALFLPDHMRYSMCNKLFKRTLFEDITFPEGKSIDDKRTIYKLIDKCEKVSWCPAPKYHYVMREGSIMHHMSHEKCMDFIEASDELEEFIRMRYPETMPGLIECYSLEATRWIDQMNACGYKDEEVTRRLTDLIKRAQR